MAIESNCPGCGTKVRVPESLLGKSVKCPKCQKVFTAEEPDAGFEEVEEEEPRPRRRPRPAPVDEYEDAPYEDEYQPRRRRGGRSRAEAAVKGPGIALLVVGILGLLYAVINLLVNVAGANPLVNQMGGGGNVAAHRAGVAIGVGLTFVWGIIVTLAGVMMLRLRSYGSVMTGAIFAMLPCNLGCLLGLPFGIWAIVVLNKPEVKRAFE